MKNTNVFTTDTHTEIKEGDAVRIYGYTPPKKIIHKWDYGGKWSFSGVVRWSKKNRRWIIDSNIGEFKTPGYQMPCRELKATVNKDTLVLIKRIIK